MRITRTVVLIMNDDDNELETLTLEDIMDIIEAAFYDDCGFGQPLDFNDDETEGQ